VISLLSVYVIIVSNVATFREESMTKTALTQIKPFYVLLTVLLLLVGCSDDNSNGDDDIVGLQINPSSLEISVDNPQTILFSVDGGQAPYIWSVSDAGLGMIDGAGDNVVYESTTSLGANVIMVRDSQQNVGNVVITQN